MHKPFPFTATVCVLLGLLASPAQLSGQCIVWGKDYSFAVTAPDHWASACHVEDSLGVTVALWPNGFTWATGPAVMYITVSVKGPFSLQAFADDELTRFRTAQPTVVAQDQPPLHDADGHRILLRHLTGDAANNVEAVAYAEQESVFLVLALSARGDSAFKAYYPAFRALVTEYRPLKLKVKKE